MSADEPAAGPAAAPTPARRRAHWPFWVAGVLVLLLVVLPGSALWWASSDGSLARVLRLAQRFLPADQTLVFTEARGSITGGGGISHLQWEAPGISLTLDGLQMDWSLRQYFSGDLRLRTLRADNVLVRLTPVAEPPPEEPFVMPEQLTLPVKLTVPLAINRLEIRSGAGADSSSQVIERIVAGYRYDGQHHALRLQSLQYGLSQAQAELQLHARELTLAGRIAASLRDPVADIPLAMRVHLQAGGTLAGGDAAGVHLQLDAHEQDRSTQPPDAATLLQQLRPQAEDLEPGTAGERAWVHAVATVHPWRSQPVEALDLQARRLNAGAFHGSAPVTRIDANASVQPVADATPLTWNLLATLTNALPGAWDSGRLPLRTAELRGALSRELALIETAHLELGGSAPAGNVQLIGRLPLGQDFQPTLRLQLQQLDLRPLLGSLPRTQLDGEVQMDPLQADTRGDTGWQARVDVRNGLPGPLDADRLPLDRAQAALRGTSGTLRADSFQLHSGAGELRAQGRWNAGASALQAEATLDRLPLRRIHRDLAGGPAELSGTLSVRGDLQQGLAFDADIRSDAQDVGDAAPRAEWEIRAIQAQGRWSPQRLQVQNIHLDAFGATADGSAIDVVLPGLDSIQAQLKAAAPGLSLDADARMRRQSGGGTLSLQLASAEQLLAWLRELPLLGERMPALEATGGASLEADWQGGWRQWSEGLTRPARHPGLRLNATLSAQGLHVEMPPGDSGSALILDVDSLAAGVQGNLAAASLRVEGDLRLNDIGTELDVNLQMTRGERSGQHPLWQFTLQQLRLAATLPEQAAPWQLQVSEGLQLSLATGEDFELRAAAGQLTLSPPADAVLRQQNLELAWEPMLWRQTGDVMTVQSTGTVRGLQPGWLDLLRLAEPPGPLENAGLRTDLVIGGEWELQLDQALAVNVHLRRDAGDVWLLGPALRAEDSALRPPADNGTAAGLRTFDLRLQSAEEQLSLALEWDTEHAGTISARAATRLAPAAGGWQLAENAPLSGGIQARLQDMGVWGFLAPPGWRMQGTLQADIQLGGSVQEPQLRGPIEASGLTIRSVLDGVELHQGVLKANLEGRQLRLQELTFQGGTGSKAYVPGISGNRTQPPRARGSLRASGIIDWSGIGQAAPGDTGISVDMQAELDRMQVLVRNDRQLSLSGDLSAALAEGALRVRGDLRVDRATILLPEAGAPTLGDDVIVLRGDEPLEAIEALAVDEPRGGLQATRRMDVEIAIDLGRDLALNGQGITTRLEGALTVRSSNNPGQPFAVFGEVRTDEGRYRAWGQSLDVETGVVAFNGSYLNPALNLLAIRPEIEVRAGVRVTGTLLAPRVELYSDPPLPEAEKLSWVVLGRATAIGGGEGTSMQRAALGMLAGQAVSSLTDDLGVDELGLDDSALSIGKRISDEFYVTYEAGLSGAASTLYIFYDLTRRLTLRGETGEASAVDLIYTIDYD